MKYVLIHIWNCEMKCFQESELFPSIQDAKEHFSTLYSGFNKGNYRLIEEKHKYPFLLAQSLIERTEEEALKISHSLNIETKDPFNEEFECDFCGQIDCVCPEEQQCSGKLK